MPHLDKNAIIAAPDLKRETVDVPEWGEGAQQTVQEMSALERDQFRADLLADPATASVNIPARVLVRCLIDPETGARLFVDEEAPALGRKSQAAIRRLFVVAQRLNAMPESRSAGDVLALQDIIALGEDGAIDYADLCEKMVALAKARFEDDAVKN